MNEHIEPIRRTVTLNYIMDRIQRTVYTILPDTTTTVCQLFMKNGFVILGTSGCVDPTKFNKALGEKYAYEKAIDKAWELEGYLLAEELHQLKDNNDFALGTACDLSGEGTCEACQ